MASSLLYHESEMLRQITVGLTVYRDAVRLDAFEGGRQNGLGWFIDEVSAISAAAEYAIMVSALLPDLRRMPELVIRCEYRNEETGRTMRRFKRATRIKHTNGERRVVMVPGTFGKSWMRTWRPEDG